MDKWLESAVMRIENLEDERKGIGADIKDVFTEVKAKGYNPKVLRRLIRERRRDAAEVEAEEAELCAYKAALGMAVELVRDQGLSLRDAARKTGTSKSSIHRALAVPAVSQEVSHDPNTGEIETGDGTPPEAPASGTACEGAPSPTPGPIPDVPRETESAATRAARWAATSRTGISSLAIMSMMMGQKPNWHSYPHDGADFGRCEGLLDAVPEWRDRMSEMATAGPEWAALAEHWPELSAMHSAGDYNGVYRRIGELVRPLEAKRRNVVQVGDGAMLIMPDDAPDPGPIPEFLRRQRATA